MLELSSQRVLIPGGHGFLGRHIAAALRSEGLPACSLLCPRSSEFDLRSPDVARRLLDSWGGQGPTLIINCAGFVGGLGANRQWPARFFSDHLSIALNLVEQARQSGAIARGLTFVQIGTMCSYPADAPLPYAEHSLWRGLPDPEIASYGIAKLALLQMLEAYRLEHGLRSAYVIPTGFFGPGDNLNPANSHVAGAMVRKYVDAVRRGDREVVNWGSGSPTRDFIYIEDAAEGVLAAAHRIDRPVPINLTGGVEVSIRTLAELVASLSGFSGRTVWDTSKGDGQPRRSLDGSRAASLLDWHPRVSLEEGLRRTVRWYQSLPSP